MAEQQVAKVARVVHYMSRNGDGIVSPAIVLRTRASTNLDVIERWGPADGESPGGKGRPASLVPELPDDETVDLLAHGLGGDYREYAVPYAQIHEDTCLPCSAQFARTWHWPTECGTGELACQNPEGEAPESEAEPALDGDDTDPEQAFIDRLLEGNLDEIGTWAAEHDDADYLRRVAEAESAGKGRKGVAEAIERRLNELAPPQLPPNE